MKTLCVRFDIDTPTCLREGVPRILDLAERAGFRPTFFLSVGRAVSRLSVVRRIVAGSRARVPRAVGFSSLDKLGVLPYAWVALRNPEIGRSMPEIVHRMARAAEVGLHGGRNHDTWQNTAGSWPEARIADELDWALAWTAEMGLAISGFSSPGWAEPPGLPKLLKARGFLYRADRHGEALSGGVEEAPGFFNLATNLAGEPGGVAYLEHMRARRLSDAEIRAEFRRSLDRIGDQVVMYDHPYYAGLRALELLADLVDVARDAGFDMVTLSDMANRLAGFCSGGVRADGICQ